MNTDLTQFSPLLIELLLKSGIVVAIGFSLVFAFRKSAPEWKHRILLRAFGVAMVIPLVLMLPRWEINCSGSETGSSTSLAIGPCAFHRYGRIF